MDLTQLNQSLKAKTLQFEVSIETGAPYAVLLELYKEIKDLRYQIVIAELSEASSQKSGVTE